MKNAAEVGTYAIDALKEIQVRHPSIGDVRGVGLMIGVEFVMNRETKELAHDLRDRVVDLAFERGLSDPRMWLECDSNCPSFEYYQARD